MGGLGSRGLFGAGIRVAPKVVGLGSRWSSEVGKVFLPVHKNIFQK